jgi:hypothetical protein
MADDTSFDDAEPEDAWDAEDPIPVQIDNLFLRLAVLDMLDGDHDHLLLNLLKRSFIQRRTSNITDRARVRIEQALEDIEFVRGRLDNGG